MVQRVYVDVKNKREWVLDVLVLGRIKGTMLAAIFILNLHPL